MPPKTNVARFLDQMGIRYELRECEVAMDDPLPVRGVQCMGNFDPGGAAVLLPVASETSLKDIFKDIKKIRKRPNWAVV
jgi:hypothetical protein